MTRLLLGWSLLAFAWVFANPPFAAPDEADHYVRAVGIAEGHLVGAPAPDVALGSNPAEIRFDKSTQRALVIPARLDPSPLECYLANPHLSARCLDRGPLRGPPARLITSVGTYPPLGLLAAAAVVRHADNPQDADRLGRLASMSVALALLIGAALALFDPVGGWLSLVGLLAVCTPTAIFLAASLTPSGISVSAGIALTAALLAIGRRRRAPLGVWVLAGVSGATLAFSHPTGIGWALLITVGFVVVEGVGAARGLVREQRPASLIGISLFAVGVLAGLVWKAHYGPNTPIAYRAIPLALSRVPEQFWNGLRDLVAGFGYLEFRVPLALYLLWFAFVGLIFVAALQAAERRNRNAVLASAALAFVIPVGVWMVFARATGIGINGREYMPVLVAIPMLAAEVLYRHRDRVPAETTTALARLATITAVLQFVAWYLNAQRAAVGTAGSLVFVSDAGWTPPLGWPVWLLVAGCGTMLLASLTIGRSIGDLPRHLSITRAPSTESQVPADSP